MAGSTTKKAVIQRFDKEALSGYVNPQSYLQLTGIELLSAQGNVANVPYDEIKTVAFVRDFETPSDARRLFNTRPKMEGLWMSFEFRDGEVMEGVMPNNLLPLEPHGFTIIPPDPYSNQQRVFIPRMALRAVEVLGVVGSPLKKRRPKAAAKEQIGLFEE
ncbi:MAG TPA: hypothetical protein VLY24_16040 [Bryobacteraceae bacterium]|nr:hypothetical protein [Bryobacteraceae bacterium]